MPDQYIVEAFQPTTADIIRTGPLPIFHALGLVDLHLAPHGWTPRLLSGDTYITPSFDALATFSASKTASPVLHQEFTVALRGAVFTGCGVTSDSEPDDPEVERAAVIITHLEPHRPIAMWTGDEECLLAECDHDPDSDHLQPAGVICVACSPVYDTCSEYGPEWFDALQVGWPCEPVRKAAAAYEVPLPAETTTDAEAPEPCQPIGCDNGHHLPGCTYAVVDSGGEI